MIDGALLAVLTVQDADDDTDSTSLAIGDAVKIEDDGPTMTVTEAARSQSPPLR